MLLLQQFSSIQELIQARRSFRAHVSGASWKLIFLFDDMNSSEEDRQGVQRLHSIWLTCLTHKCSDRASHSVQVVLFSSVCSKDNHSSQGVERWPPKGMSMP